MDVCVGVCVGGVCVGVGVYDNIKQNFLHVYGCLSIIITAFIEQGLKILIIIIIIILVEWYSNIQYIWRRIDKMLHNIKRK